MQDHHARPDQTSPDYDLHIPKVLTYPLPVSILSILLAGLLYVLFQTRPILAGVLVGISLLAGGAYVGLSRLLQRYTNLERRLKARDMFLDAIPWQGDEVVLDVGCGNGILLLGAAKRLTSGKGIGIEIWTEFSGDSRPEAFQKNATLEGVADKVSLHNEDVRQLPYDNESFDVIISGLTMHHISHGADTQKAIREMMRVLKPDGWIGVYDNPFTVSVWTKLLRQHGLTITRKERDMVFATKPHGLSTV